MKRKLHLHLFLLILLAFLIGCDSAEQISRKVCFDDGWKFYCGHAEGAEDMAFNDARWRVVDLPHDWSIEPLDNQGDSVVGPFSKKSVGGAATGQTVGGEGWYRKTFVLSAAQRNKLVLLYFEGIYMESEVWINGQKADYHPYGYTSFRCDITTFLKPVGEKNVVAVKVLNEGKNSRWYAGSGIYRHVWIVTTDKLHLDEWATQIKSTVNGRDARIEVMTEVFNSTDDDIDCEVNVTIMDDKERIVKTFRKTSVRMGESLPAVVSIGLKNPKLWSVDTPNLYNAVITLVAGGERKDRISVPFGIRTVTFSAERGFELNGVNMLLNGGCVHHDNGFLGAAAIDRAEERKVELLKANGYNAVRCAHNPPSEKFLESCDRLGLLVIDEAFDQWRKPKNADDYHRFFDGWCERDIESMVRRDRNHPSIIMWSIGNEIQERSDDSGAVLAKRLKAAIRKYDVTRPITAAVNDFWDNPGYKWDRSEKAFAQLDVAGYNYMHREYENDMKEFPDRVIYGSETTAGESAINRDYAEKYKCVVGEFVWTAMDYLGESGIGHAFAVRKGEKAPPQFIGWPWFNAWCGDMDLCGDKKPQSYYRDVIWRRSPIEMMVHTPLPENTTEKVSYWGWPDEWPSWNWAGNEGREMAVNVYTRYPEIKLFLNGNETGAAKSSSATKYTAAFGVRYEPGNLKAVGYENGIAKDSVILTTTAAPASIRLTADRKKIRNSRDDLSYVKIEIIDSNGLVVPDCNVAVRLSVKGYGELAASGNACPTDMKSFRSPTPNVFHGRALAILRPSGKDEGEITLTVSADGLPDATIGINVESKQI